MASIKPLDDSQFLFNGKPYPRNFTATSSRFGIKIYNHSELIFDGPLTNLTIDGKQFGNKIEAIKSLQPLIIPTSSAIDLTLVTDKQEEIKQEIIKLQPLPIIPFDVEITAGTYSSADLLALYTGDNANAIHSINVISEESGVFSLDFEGDVEVATMETSQTVKAALNQALPNLTLEINAGFTVVVNLELIKL